MSYQYSEVNVYSSTDYDSFKFINRNRKVEHANRVRESVEKIGPLFKAFPILVRPSESDTLFEILDGQARFTVAKEMGKPIHFIVTQLDFDVIPYLNSITTTWSTGDYLDSWCEAGKDQYVKLKKFMQRQPHMNERHSS